MSDQNLIQDKKYSIKSLQEIMNCLRAPDGCPWDREQTHQSLTTNLIEEAYEVIDAINKGNSQLLADELGDLLLQIVFHAQIGTENGHFTLDDVIQAICEKLIRRHPHVFGDTKVSSVDDVLQNWEAIKKTEKFSQDRQSILDGIPSALPSLVKAAKVQSKAAKVGFDWTDTRGPLHKLEEELGELQSAVKRDDLDNISEEMGDLLFSLVNVARHLKVDPESALRLTIDKFTRRFWHMEKLANDKGQQLQDLNLEELDQMWEDAKSYFRKNPQE